MKRFFVLLMMVLAVNSIVAAQTESDTHHIESAQRDGSLSPDVVACAEDIQCQDHADAAFRVAANRFVTLKNQNYAIYVMIGPEGLPIVTTEYDETNPAHRDALIFGRRGNIYTDREGLAEAIILMERAVLAGSHDAANELGYLYLGDPWLFDPAKARSFLEGCARDGDPLCMFNLARVDSIATEDGCGNCLPLLRGAAAGSNDMGVHIALQVAESIYAPGIISTPIQTDPETFEKKIGEVRPLFPAWFIGPMKP